MGHCIIALWDYVALNIAIHEYGSKLLGLTEKALIKVAGERSMATLEELQEFKARIGESVNY